VSNLSTSIDPGSLKIGILVLIQIAGFVRDNGTNQTKESIGVEKPFPKSFSGGSEHNVEEYNKDSILYSEKDLTHRT